MGYTAKLAQGQATRVFSELLAYPEARRSYGKVSMSRSWGRKREMVNQMIGNWAERKGKQKKNKQFLGKGLAGRTSLTTVSSIMTFCLFLFNQGNGTRLTFII